MSQSRDQIVIDGRAIGPNHPPYVVAEISGNHNGDIERAFRLLAAAKDAGADAVKLQTYTADSLTIDHDGPGFTLTEGLWAGRTLYALYQEAHTPWEWHQQLFAKGRELGITIFSSPFDASAIDLLEGLGAPAYKIASFELVDIPLIERAASTGKPLIISTGLANAVEIGDAFDAARRAGADEILLLHCISGYPTPASESNLRTIPDLIERFDTLVGLSDHTLGTLVPVAAVALGAVAVEKHFTLARGDGGPDAAFSLEADELAELVHATRTAWESLGQASYELMPSERPNLGLRRSLYVVEDIAAGEVFTGRNLRSIRPGAGLAPKHYHSILGARAARDLKRGTPLTWDAVRRADD